MDFIIDIQGFRDAGHAFLPKEVSVISLQDSVVGHWLIAPPYPFEDLPDDVKTTNDYISLRMLGIQWFDGEISLRKLRYHFYNIARKASRIYVRGDEKARYIESIMARSIINIEEYAPTPSFAELQEKFPSKQVCCFHAYRGDEYKNQYCTVRRSHTLKQWMYSLLPPGQAAIKNPDSNAFYDALKNLVFPRRRLVQFDLSEDEVDTHSGNESGVEEFKTPEEE